MQKNNYESLSKFTNTRSYQVESLSAPIINITVVESVTLPLNTTYKIFAYGLQGSKTQEGHVYFGKISQTPESELIVSSDIPLTEKYLCITYDLHSKKYLLKDLCMNTFVKILSEKTIENDSFISFVDRRLILKLNGTNLRIKLVETEESFEFTINDSPIVIGRSEKCNVKVNGKNISREQCTIFFDKEWFIRDGNSSNSRNGTWFMPIHICEVSDGMVFNADKSIFSVSLEKPKMNN